MSITFRCEHCRREVKAPDEAGGKRGKCPYCDHSSYIPSVLPDDDEIPLVPLDEQEERQRKKEVLSRLEVEQDLIRETGGAPHVPLEHRDELTSADLHHFVINYCLDMSQGNIERAATHAGQLAEFGGLAFQAVEDFLAGKVDEQVLKQIDEATLERFLTQLGDMIK